ncbi:MAG TPA: YhjD/YihY/BrkB family envelope integrity protein [Thermoleophilaceae bacterium]|jgi:uncharacterized BrkB/YihY/UPF0761 family membrane protein|nr:YhjD/YihY/BrkB family envelope integrity protein [Thermoleophilaceae bacterium]
MDGVKRTEKIVTRGQELATTAREQAARVPGFDALVEALETEQRSGAPLLAGGLAYRFFFWLVSFGLFAAAILSFWVRESPEDAKSVAHSFGLAGVATASATNAVNNGSHARWYFLISGVFLLLYFGIGAMRALHITGVLAWGLEPKKLQRPVRAGVLFSLALIAVVVLSLGTEWVRHHAPGTGILAIAAIGAVWIGLIALAMQLLPHGPTDSWTALLPGAVEVGVGLALIQSIVVYYLAAKLERSPDLYGTLGASTVVLLWLFLFARLIVSGMFLNATLDRRRQRNSE